MAKVVPLSDTLVVRPQDSGEPEEARGEALACVEQALRGIRFPPAGGATRITLPLIFE